MFSQVERGTANKGAEVEIIGHGSNMKTTLIGIGEPAQFPPFCA